MACKNMAAPMHPLTDRTNEQRAILFPKKWKNLGLKLPISTLPDEGVPFDASFLDWVADPKKGSPKRALLPESRLDDFILGEEIKGRCKLLKSSVREKEAPSSIRKDAYLSSCHLHCNHGPEDNRAKGSVDTKGPQRRSKIKAGESIKVGCRLGYSVKKPSDHAGYLIVTAVSLDHVDSSGAACHEQLQGRLQLSPKISETTKNWVRLQLALGLATHVILVQHRQRLLEPWLAITDGDKQRAIERLTAQRDQQARDWFMREKDVDNLKKEVESGTFKYDNDEARSLQAWVKANSASVIAYDQLMYHTSTGAAATAVGGGEASSSACAGAQDHPEMLSDVVIDQHFSLCFGDKWQLEKLARATDGKAIMLDGTFGTNKLKFPLTTIMGFDAMRNGFPGAWTISSTESRECIVKWLRALKSKLETIVPGWRPSCFIVDDAGTMIDAVWEVFGTDMPILLCIWHVKRCWLKHLQKKVRDWASPTFLFGFRLAMSHLLSRTTLGVSVEEISLIQT
jgi:hypothetical protein